MREFLMKANDYGCDISLWGENLIEAIENNWNTKIVNELKTSASGSMLDRVVLKYAGDNTTCGDKTFARLFVTYKPYSAADVFFTEKEKKGEKRTQEMTIFCKKEDCPNEEYEFEIK